eukprot:gene5186-6454_t
MKLKNLKFNIDDDDEYQDDDDHHQRHGGSNTVTEPPPTGWRGILFYLSLSSYWFGYAAVMSGVISIVWPSQIRFLGGEENKEKYVGVVPILGVVVSILVSPLAGAMSDHSKFKYGKRRIYLLVGSVISLIFLFLTSVSNSIIMFMFSIMGIQFGMNVGGGPYGGLMPDLVIKSKFGLASGFLALGNAIGNLFGVLGSGISNLPTLFLIKEKQQKGFVPKLTVKKFLLSFYLPKDLYRDFYWDIIKIDKEDSSFYTSFMIAIIVLTSIPSSIIGGPLSDKYGRKLLVYISSAVMALTTLGFLAVSFKPSIATVMVFSGLFGIGYGSYQGVDYALALDVLPDNNLAKDLSIWHQTMVIPQIFGPMVTGLILNSMKQNNNIILGYTIVFLLATIWFTLSTIMIKPIRITPKETTNNSQQNSSPSSQTENKCWGELIPTNSTKLSIYKLTNSPDEIITFGRLKTCTIQIPEPIVSGTHCTLVKRSDDETVLIQDLSTNGTFINGKPIGKGKYQILNHGDRICFGRASLDCDLTYTLKRTDFSRLKNQHPNNTKGITNILGHTMTIKKEILKEYDFISELGRGVFSVVYEGIQKATATKVAIKDVDLSKYSNEKFQLQLNREIEILKRTDHPSIIKIFDIFFTENKHLYFILELANGGELYDKIGYNMPLLNEEEAKYIFKQLLSGVSYLHSLGIAHRDLKPENILFVDDPEGDPLRIKISDFGLARFINEGELAKTLCGTPLYVAPEVIASRTKHKEMCIEGYGKTCDAWSLGAILYIILSGTPPFEDDTDQIQSTPKLFEQIVSGNYSFPPETWSSISKAAADLVQKLLTVDPNKRYTVEQALNHPWITGSYRSNNNNNNSTMVDNNINSKKRVLAETSISNIQLQSLNINSKNNNICNNNNNNNMEINNSCTLDNLKRRKTFLEDDKENMMQVSFLNHQSS